MLSSVSVPVVAVIVIVAVAEIEIVPVACDLCRRLTQEQAPLADQLRRASTSICLSV